MVEVSISKEITEYKEKIVAGLSVRQLITVGAAAAVGIPSYFGIRALFGDSTASTLVMFLVAPIFAFGFFEVRGYPMEKFLKIVYEHRFRPQKSYYQTTNFLTAFAGDDKGEIDVNALIQTKKCPRRNGSYEICHYALPTAKQYKKWQVEAKREARKAARSIRKSQKIRGRKRAA